MGDDGLKSMTDLMPPFRGKLDPKWFRKYMREVMEIARRASQRRNGDQ